jgi:hypothetical protein
MLGIEAGTNPQFKDLTGGLGHHAGSLHRDGGLTARAVDYVR